MSDKHTMLSHIYKLEQEVQELKRQIQTLKWDLEASRNICSRKSDRIQRLIEMGLETTRPEHMDEWNEEEEL